MTTTLRDLRLETAADVYKAGTLAATLHRRDDRVELLYDPTYVASGGEAIASTLPVDEGPFVAPAGAVPAFFAGLLPEGRRLAAVRAAVGTSADDELSILLAVGADTVGDVQVVPPGRRPEAVAVDDVPELAAASFPELFERAVGEEPDQVALAGLQDKVSGRMITVPVAHQGRDVILKLDPPEFPHLVANEAFFIRAAASAGLRTVEAEVVHDRDGHPGLLVTRFDRVSRSGGARARAVEDGCQVMNRWPADKYLLETAEVIRALAVRCAAPSVAAHELFRQLVFAYVSGNGDLHAKNLAVLRGEDGEWRPSPAYDLPSSAPYGDRDLALPIAGRVRTTISYRRLVELGGDVGLPERAVREVVRRQVEHAGAWWHRLDQLPFDQHRLDTLRRLTRRRRERLAAELER